MSFFFPAYLKKSKFVKYSFCWSFYMQQLSFACSVRMKHEEGSLMIVAWEWLYQEGGIRMVTSVQLS